MIVAYLALAAGIYLVGFGAVLHTENWLSGLGFKIIPALIGMGLMIAGLNMAGWL